MSGLATPLGDQVLMSEVDAWWRPVTRLYGGRDSDLVVDHTGAARVFADHRYQGFTTDQADPPAGTTAWMLDCVAVDGSDLNPWEWADAVRSVNLAVAAGPGGFFGLVAGDTVEYQDEPWLLAWGHVLLGYLPPIELLLRDANWETGKNVLGQYAARRVKRALLQAITSTRKALAQDAADVRATWR